MALTAVEVDLNGGYLNAVSYNEGPTRQIVQLHRLADRSISSRNQSLLMTHACLRMRLLMAAKRDNGHAWQIKRQRAAQEQASKKQWMQRLRTMRRLLYKYRSSRKSVRNLYEDIQADMTGSTRYKEDLLVQGCDLIEDADRENLLKESLEAAVQRAFAGRAVTASSSSVTTES
ncbi:hypothetical protein CLOM_g9655 [Closterium sp. NIES-68]|nr:hypothetical protein CLOM_g9655 [Closterium sp. NIES-68]GJP58497.1 hypothetical protein CLOP_g357 [Closterium sp. NIES-67]